MSNDNNQKSFVEEIFDKARRGNKEYRLGDFYYYGKGGLNVDARKAVEYLTKAAALGEWKSYKLLGEIYLNCEGGIEADGCKAIDYLLKYAEAAQRQMTDAEDIYLEEEINAAFKTVADLYLCGKCGVAQDNFKAIEFYKKCGEHFKSDVERLTQANENPQELIISVDEEDELDYKFLADSYRYAINGVKQNGQKALEYLIRDFEENPGWESEHEILQIYLYGCGELKPDWHKAFEFANIHFGEPLMIYDDMLALKFVCVFDDKLGYFRKDGLLTLAVLETRYNRLERLRAPKIVMANELRRAAEIYEEGYGGLEPNREKSIALYEQITELVPRDKVTKGKLAYLTGSD